MCVVSMIADDWRENILPNHPWVSPSQLPGAYPVINNPTRAEFDALRAELEKLKRELLVGKAQDVANGEPDCEMEEKIAILHDLGELLGVNFDEVFKNAS